MVHKTQGPVYVVFSVGCILFCMENKGSKFFKKGSAFLIAAVLLSSFLPKIGTSAISHSGSSKTARERVISRIGLGAITFLEKHWSKLLLLLYAGVFVYFLLFSEDNCPAANTKGNNNISNHII